MQRFYWILPYLACLTACAALNWLYFPPGTFFPDEQRFLASAVKLVATGEFRVGADRAWEMPGTVLFFSPFVRLFGPEGAIAPIRFAQSLLLALQCGLIAFIAGRVARNETAAFIAACIAALYPFLLFYQGLLLSETLFNTFLLGALAALYAWQARGARIGGLLVLACALFAAATLTKATLTVLPPLLIAVTAWTAGLAWRRIIAVLLAAACLYAAFLSPWWIRNAAVLGSFVPFTTSSAQNLYLGNNPENLEGGIDWSRDVEPEVAARLLAMPDEVARQRAFGARATAYIKEHPAAFLDVAAKKFVRFWNIIPNAPEFRGIYAVVSAVSFGPVLLLALIGLVRLARQWRLLVPIVIVIGYFTAVHTVTIASLRYRLPVEPLLIVLAAEPLAAIVARLFPRAMHGTEATASHAS
ncbi:MAG: hypothetical protein ACK4UO_06890 [Pseudolabrys sp.]